MSEPKFESLIPATPGTRAAYIFAIEGIYRAKYLPVVAWAICSYPNALPNDPSVRDVRPLVYDQAGVPNNLLPADDVDSGDADCQFVRICFDGEKINPDEVRARIPASTRFVVRGDQVKLGVQDPSQFPRTAEGFLSRHPHNLTTKEN